MNKIVFYSSVPGLVESAPIYSAKRYRPRWVEEARKDYIEQMKFSKIKDFGHIYQCPGIFELFSEGYIVPMWHDIVIETNGDRKRFKYQVPSDTMQTMMEDVEIINHHDKLAEFIPYPEHSMEIVLKLNTPWRVICPKNVKLLILPISYPDEHDFTGVTGILDPGVTNEINIQLFWHKLKGSVYIKAGTPMMQIIPLTEKKYEMVCRYKTALDDLWIKKKKFMSTFVWGFKKSLLKKAYHDHYKL